MAVVTQAPSVVNGVVYPTQFFTNLNPPGYFQVGNTLFLVLAYSDLSAIGVYASTDQGVTWIEQNVANHIVLPSNSVGSSCYFNAATGIITVLYHTTSGADFVYKVAQFDTGHPATGWGASSAASAAIGGNALPGAVYQQANGAIVVVANTGNGANQALSYLTLIAGAWTGPVLLVATSSTANDVYATAFDPVSGNDYVFYTDAAGDFVCSILSPTFLLSAPVVLSSAAVFDYFPCSALIWNGNIVVSWSENYTTGGPAMLKVAIAPLGTATFTTYLVDTAASNSYFYYYPGLAVNNAGKLTVFVGLAITSVPPPSQILQYTFGGSTWGASVIFYDQVANPPPAALPLTINSFAIAAQAALQRANGSWLFLAQLTLGSPSLLENVGFTLTSPGLIPTTTPGDGGRKTQILTPNQFDFCLHREYRLFCNIDYDAKGCAKLPACFNVPESEWGEAG